MLHIENIFLPLNFGPQLFFGRQVGQILRHEQVVVIVQDRVSRNVLAGFATQQNADCGVVALFAFKFIVHPNIQEVYKRQMLMLVIGGAASGKSAYAEHLAVQSGGPRYYLATMQVLSLIHI